MSKFLKTAAFVLVGFVLFAADAAAQGGQHRGPRGGSGQCPNPQQQCPNQGQCPCPGQCPNQGQCPNPQQCPNQGQCPNQKSGNGTGTPQGQQQRKGARQGTGGTNCTPVGQAKGKG